tara:strand:+ start:10050 stop:11459 length:1410 start_codon:yes stop_codon:yes gene_type:complete
MPTQTGSLYPSYATPRFCVDHILRTEGIGALSGWTAATGYPLDRILDNQRGLVAKHNAAEAVTLKLSREVGTTVSHRLSFDRVVIFGSNFADNVVRVTLKKSDEEDASDIEYINQAISGVGYGQAEYDLAPPNVIDWELDGLVEARFVYLILTAGRSGYTAPEIGELWLTRTLQPSTGVAHRWTNGVLPAVTAAETSAKLVTHSIDGAERAQYAISWDRLANGADLEMLRYVKRIAGIRRNVLLYEHADFGTSPVVLDACDDHTSYNLTNFTAADNVNGAPGANDDAVDFTALNPSTPEPDFCSLDVYDDATAPLDLTDTVLEWWTRFDDADTVSDAEEFFYFRVLTADPISAGYFYFRKVVEINSTAAHWYKCAVDLTTWGPVEPDTAEASAYESPPDLTRVTNIRMSYRANAAGNVIRHGKFYLRRKRQAPVPCFLTGYQEVQVGESPSAGAGPLYQVTMTLEEALA